MQQTVLARFFIYLIRQYQRHAPDHIRARCRYDPSCSAYAILAIEKYGAFKGAGKAVRRILRCRPPHGGEDYP